MKCLDYILLAMTDLLIMSDCLESVFKIFYYTYSISAVVVFELLIFYNRTIVINDAMIIYLYLIKVV